MHSTFYLIFICTSTSTYKDNHIHPHTHTDTHTLVITYERLSASVVGFYMQLTLTGFIAGNYADCRYMCSRQLQNAFQKESQVAPNRYTHTHIYTPTHKHIKRQTQLTPLDRTLRAVTSIAILYERKLQFN